MDREPPESPDYFENFEQLDPALYKSPSQPPQLPLSPHSPSLHRPSNRLINAESEAQVPYISNASANDNSEHFGTSTANVFPITFVSSETEVPVARRGCPPNPEKQKQPAKETWNPGRPPDPTKHRPYSGPRGMVDVPSAVPHIQGIGLAAAQEPISTTSVSVQAPAMGPRIEHVVPDPDPDRIVDPDDANAEDPLGLMGEGQGNDDDACSSSNTDIPAGKRGSLPPFVKTSYETFVNRADAAAHYQVHQSFWVPQKANIFLLRGDLRSKAAAGKPTAEAMYNARLFYWDPRYFAEIACPACAYLSHRGAMAKPVFEMMWTVFHYGLGSKQFSNSLQVLHRLHFDKLHTQYLDGVIAWAKAYPEKMPQDQPLVFTEFSSFGDPKGYSRFVPSSSWLRMMYDVYIEEHGAAMDQQAAMKSLRLGAIDHHYKTTKQIMKINGESVFAATLTLTNEFGEARVLAFAATSAHNEFESALQKVKQNLDLYGLSQPEAIFTDNPAADKQFLENIFDSLTKHVVPVEKYPGMEHFDLPDGVDIRISRSAAEIENELAKIMHDLNTDDPEDKLVVGFDAEWNVDTTLRASHPTAIIQIAYKSWVNIFQIGHFKRKLPMALINFLSTGQIIKAGRAIKQDLSRLEEETNHGSFCGAVDLARMAKDSRVISDARMGLADLCARILGKRLEKEPGDKTKEPIWVSSNWNKDEVSSEQICCPRCFSLPVHI
ncbi:hypothetical protein DFH08DRAFT_935178 [Mycena albidolilacea]|uniref:3'-5' exonuclease n=1 Tax=Mycena albidolilacea TaxID=1033008 RepID=A0AAD7EVN3_9AGAR|nr:hypothetical protein DFH08DRAFT_935178 [Mycena albidolilacea]